MISAINAFFLWLGSQLRSTPKVLLLFGVAVLVGPATHNILPKKGLTYSYCIFTTPLKSCPVSYCQSFDYSSNHV
jgi:hypothetical protein